MFSQSITHCTHITAVIFSEFALYMYVCLPKFLYSVIALPNALFVGQMSQIQLLLDKVNNVMKCQTPYCRGNVAVFVAVVIHVYIYM